ncbi:MAG: S24 family peptidase [Gammaproteobacteria bacterium]
MTNLKLEAQQSALSVRLGLLMREKGLNIPKLAKKTGIALGTIQKILSDPNSNPTYSTLKTLAAAFGISISALLSEQNSTISFSKQVRVIDWENIMSLFDDIDSTKLVNLNSFVTCNVELSDHAFALKLAGGGLLPFFKENTILIFDPHKKPYNRAFVLVKFQKHNIPSLKQLIIDEPKYYVKSINQELAHEKIEALHPKDRVIATLVQSLSNF